MDQNISPLFEPLAVKGYTFRNRIVMPAMVTKRDIVSQAGIEWYGEHARGGVALVIVEATALGRFGCDLEVHDLRRLVEALHKGGALAAIQLLPVAPDGKGPAALDPSEIREIIDAFEAAARMCVEAGFDGVEPHGAHGTLLNRFFSPADCARTDAFGGTLRNRMRMGIEVVRACRHAIGRDKLLLYRHTPLKEDSYTLEESLPFVERLVLEGVDILDISPASAEAAADLAEPFRSFRAPVIGVGLMDEVERALEALAWGRADLIAVGQGLIADPQWPSKVRQKHFDEIVKCIRCNEKCHGNLREGLPIECTQWRTT